MKRLFLFVGVFFFASFFQTVFGEGTWSGMIVVDKTSSIHSEAARERPVLSSPIIVHVDENSQAYKDGLRSGDYIVGTADKEINTIAELETILEKNNVPLKIHSAAGIRIVTYSPSPTNKSAEAYKKIKEFIRAGKVKENIETILKLIAENEKSPIVNFMGAFAFGAIKEREKANVCLEATVRNAPKSTLSKIAMKRLPREIQEKLDAEIAKAETAPLPSPSPASAAVAVSPEADGGADLATNSFPDMGKLAGSIDPKVFARATLDQKIQLLRAEVEKTPNDKWLRNNLAHHLIKKVETQKNKPYEELEPLLKEALDMAPDPFFVQYTWGKILYAMKNYEGALPRLEEAVRLNSEHLDATMKLGFTLVFCMKYEDAIPHFERARKKIPTDFPLLYYLGLSYLEAKEYDKAVEILEESLQHVRSQAEAQLVQSLLNKAKEHGASSEGSTKEENQRFIVQFAGDSQKDLGEMSMGILEEVYDTVTSNLMYKPDIKISVFFFRTEDFYKLSKMPGWAGAVAQGEKILVPLRQGYSDINSVKGILAHEFTHVIINLKTNNRCPTWIHEGLAVYHENQFSYGDPNQLRPDYEKVFREVIQEQKKVLPLNQIQLDYRTQNCNISLGYVESYMAMRFFIEKWNWSGIDEMFTAISQGSHLENAIEQATGRSFAQFQNEFFEWLQGVQ